MILCPLEYVVCTAKKGRIVLWEEAAEAVVHTIVPTIRAVIRTRADRTVHQVLRTILQVRHTDHRGLPTDPLVRHTRTIQVVLTEPGAAVNTAAAVSMEAQPAALADAGGS